MLKILDRYIIGKFLSTFFFTVLIILMISMIIDFSEKVEKFIEEPITKAEIFLEYYPSFAMFIAGMLWPLFTLIAVIFFTSRLAANSEVISIFNAGVSFYRFLRPYLIAATFLMVLHLLGTHFLLPLSNQHQMRIVYTYLDKDEDKGKTRDVHLFVAPQTQAYIGYYRKQDSTARDFRLEHFVGNELVSMTKANRAEWLPETGKWRLYEYQVHTFDGLKEHLKVDLQGYIDTTLSLYPSDFVDYSGQQSMMTTPSLVKYIHQQRTRGAGNTRKYLLELHRRSAEPFTIWILTLIGVSLAARKVRGGVGLHLAIGIGLGAVYILLTKFTTVFAMGQAIPVLLGAWVPNLFFTSIALWLVSRAQK